MFDFITIGGTTRDVCFFTDEGVLLDNHRDVLRQKLLAFESGAKIKVDKFYYSYGGGAANAAVCLANFGFKAACLAPVGDDESGRLIIENLQSRRVSTELIQTVKKVGSGFSFVLIAPSGERIIFAQRGANTKLVIKRSDLGALRQAKNIYIASLSGAWQANLDKIFSAVDPKGQRVFWNPGMTQYLNGVSKIAKYLPRVTVFSTNEDEALELVIRSEKHRHLSRRFLDKTENLIRLLHSFGPQIVVITLGQQGVLVYDGHQIYRQTIIKTKNRVDTTGIGDIFNSTFAAGLNLFSGDIKRSLDLGRRNTAAKVQHLGAQNGLLKK